MEEFEDLLHFHVAFEYQQPNFDELIIFRFRLGFRFLSNSMKFLLNYYKIGVEIVKVVMWFIVMQICSWNYLVMQKSKLFVAIFTRLTLEFWIFSIAIAFYANLLPEIAPFMKCMQKLLRFPPVFTGLTLKFWIVSTAAAFYANLLLKWRHLWNFMQKLKWIIAIFTRLTLKFWIFSITAAFMQICLLKLPHFCKNWNELLQFSRDWHWNVEFFQSQLHFMQICIPKLPHLWNYMQKSKIIMAIFTSFHEVDIEISNFCKSASLKWPDLWNWMPMELWNGQLVSGVASAAE